MRGSNVTGVETGEGVGLATDEEERATGAGAREEDAAFTGRAAEETCAALLFDEEVDETESEETGVREASRAFSSSINFLSLPSSTLSGSWNVRVPSAFSITSARTGAAKKTEPSARIAIEPAMENIRRMTYGPW